MSIDKTPWNQNMNKSNKCISELLKTMYIYHTLEFVKYLE